MELSRGQRISAFKEACEKGADAGAQHILLRALPAGSHEAKRNALPDLVSEISASFGGAIFQTPQTIGAMLDSIPKSQDGREEVAVEAIRRATHFLGCDL